MHVGLIVSLLFHASLLVWTVLTIHKTEPFKTPELQPVEVAIVTADDLVRLTKGDRNSKNLEASGKDGAAKEPPKKDVKTPPPPPPPPPAAAAPPPPPPPSVQPKQDDIAALMKNEPPPPPVPAKQPAPPPPPGPTPDDQAALQQKLDDEAKRVADAKVAADPKADRLKKLADLKKAADDKKRRDDLAKKQAEAKKREEDKKKSFANVENVLKGLPDDGPQKALVSQQVKPAAPAGAPGPVSAKKGPQAGAPEGKDTKLTASEASVLIGTITGKVKQCWNINAGMDGAAQLVPKVEFELNRDGSVRGVPKVVNSSPSPQFQDAANGAIRAIIQCQPYTGLPPERYENWEVVRLTFDPTQMFR